MSRLFPLSLALGAALIATIVWEVRDSSSSDLETAAGGTAPSRTGPRAPSLKSADVVDNWVTTALERPLFREDRRPVRTAGDPARGATGPVRLTGVVTGPFGSRAIFQSPDSEKPIVAEEKARLNGFVVRSIEPGKAVIEEPNGNLRTLTPSFSTTEQAPNRQN